ncbi:MAG TPA: hypothetical protein VIL13_12500 [Longimicrobiales bacterium]
MPESPIARRVFPETAAAGAAGLAHAAALQPGRKVTFDDVEQDVVVAC